MRIISVKRGFSRRILFGYEREVTDRIPYTGAFTISRKDGKGKRVVMARNPYLKGMLIDRYQIYKSLLFTETIADRSGNKKDVVRIDVDKYAEAVRKWYKDHQFVDKAGNPNVWTAIHRYEDEARRQSPNDDWWNFSPSSQDKKSHHSQGEVSKQREREKRKEWRQSEVGRKSAIMSRQKAKLNK